MVGCMVVEMGTLEKKLYVVCNVSANEDVFSCHSGNHLQLQRCVRLLVDSPCDPIVLQRHAGQELKVNIESKSQAVERKFLADGPPYIGLNLFPVHLTYFENWKEWNTFKHN